MPVEGLLPPGVIGGFSGRVWNGFPIEGIINGQRAGFLRRWEAGNLGTADTITTEAYWDQGLRLFLSSGGAATYSAGTTGPLAGVTLGSDDDNEGAGFRDQSQQVKVSRGNAMMAWEVECQFSTIADTTFGAFLGLIENSAITATSPIAAAGTLADLNFVGFHRLEGDGDKLDLVYKANGVTQVTVLADAITLVAATPVRLGMTYRPEQDPFTESRYVFRWWLNGANITTGTSYKVIPSADGTDFPNDIMMGLIATVLNAAGSSPGTLKIHRMMYGQVF